MEVKTAFILSEKHGELIFSVEDTHLNPPTFAATRIETGKIFYDSLSEQERQLIVFKDCDHDFHTGNRIGKWTLEKREDWSGKNEWAIAFEGMAKQKERELPVSEMDDAALAAHLRKFPTEPRVTAEALARILEWRVVT